MGQLENLRLVNRARVVDVLRRRAAVSRSELVQLTGLSRTTVAGVVAELQARGLVVERRDATGVPQTGLPQSGRGRPPVLLSLDATAGAAVGLSFGHAQVRVAVADLSSTILAELAAELDVDHEPATALSVAASLADEALSRQASSAARSWAPRSGSRLRSTDPRSRSTPPESSHAGSASTCAANFAPARVCRSTSRTTRTSARSARSSPAPDAASRTSST